MKALTNFCLILMFALESSIIMKTCFGGSKKQGVGSHWKVTIYNHQTNASLLAHCKSKDDDLGAHVMGIRGQYYWTFRENFGQTTLYWCSFSSLNGHVTAEVFWPERGNWLEERCFYENCIWAAFNDGIYLANLPLRQFELMHRWETGVHVLQFKGEYDWEFKENVWGTTLFWCDFQSKFGHTSFEVFWPENRTWLADRCNNYDCIWAVDDKGFSLFNIQTQTFELIHGW